MILGIDASNVRSGGGLTHLVQLLESLNPTKHQFEKIVIWSRKSTLNSLEDQPWLIKRNDFFLEGNNFIFRALWQWRKLGKLTVEENCSLLFIPGGSFLTSFRPIVTMSQNLLPFKWKEIKRYGFSLFTFKLLLLRFFQSRSFKRSNGIIFLTKNARDTVLEKTGTLKGKTRVIPHGIHKRFFNPPRIQKKSIKNKSNHPFKLIYVSSIQPYKHQDNVVIAVSRLLQKGIPIIFDMYGSPQSRAIKKLQNIIQKYDSTGQYIRYHGETEHADIQKLYFNYDIAIFASSCETFGQILLEGIAAGLPTICSNMSSMPELLGDSVIYFDPLNIDSIVLALDTFISSPQMRSEKAEKSFELVKHFSWQKTADETFSFLHSVLSK